LPDGDYAEPKYIGKGEGDTFVRSSVEPNQTPAKEVVDA